MRTSLIPGLLKTIRENRSHALPIKIFETSDVVFKDHRKERQASNERRAAAIWCNKTAGFEIVHGVLDRAMKMLEIPRAITTDAAGYHLKEINGMTPCLSLIQLDMNHIADPMFFPGRAASIIYRVPIMASDSPMREINIGRIGVLHPTVLEKFEIGYPCSALEFTLEPFRKDWLHESE